MHSSYPKIRPQFALMGRDAESGLVDCTKEASTCNQAVCLQLNSWHAALKLSWEEVSSGDGRDSSLLLEGLFQACLAGGDGQK